jgi:hypothetical protein
MDLPCEEVPFVILPESLCKLDYGPAMDGSMVVWNHGWVSTSLLVLVKTGVMPLIQSADDKQLTDNCRSTGRPDAARYAAPYASTHILKLQ